MDDIRNSLDNHKSSNISKVSRGPCWQVEKIVFTKGTNFDIIGVFVVANVAFVIRPNQLLRRFNLYRRATTKVSQHQHHTTYSTLLPFIHTLMGTTFSRNEMKRAAFPLSGK
jgi:hypothetical protein